MIDLKEYVDITYPGITFNQQYKVNKKEMLFLLIVDGIKFLYKKYKKGI